jgi:hypothetical protein
MLFCWGENGNLRAWRLASNGVATYIACSAEVAAAQSREPFGGMPGGMMCLSGDSMTPNTAVLWACIPYLASEERVDFMAVTAQSCPDFRTVSEFRKRHLKALSGLFVQVLALCRKAGLAKLGHVRLMGPRSRPTLPSTRP